MSKNFIWPICTKHFHLFTNNITTQERYQYYLQNRSQIYFSIIPLGLLNVLWHDAWRPKWWSHRRRSIAKQRLGKQVSTATDTEATIQEFLGTMFTVRSVQSGNTRMELVNWCSGPDPPGWASLESETVKYGAESRGNRTREWLRWRDPGATANDRLILSLERMINTDYNRMRSVVKIILVVSLKGLYSYL
jgi:hypothetical protein